MLKLSMFFWILGVALSVWPGASFLSVIFCVIGVSIILFFSFSFNGSSLMGFLWVLVYLGGMMIVFLYVVFFFSSSQSVGKSGEGELPTNLFQGFFIVMIFFISLKKFQSDFFFECSSSSLEFQELYSVILSSSSLSFFSFLLVVISVSLVILLGVLVSNTSQSKFYVFSHFIM